MLMKIKKHKLIEHEQIKKINKMTNFGTEEIQQNACIVFSKYFLYFQVLLYFCIFFIDVLIVVQAQIEN